MSDVQHVTVQKAWSNHLRHVNVQGVNERRSTRHCTGRDWITSNTSLYKREWISCNTSLYRTWVDNVQHIAVQGVSGPRATHRCTRREWTTCNTSLHKAWVDHVQHVAAQGVSGPRATLHLGLVVLRDSWTDFERVELLFVFIFLFALLIA